MSSKLGFDYPALVRTFPERVVSMPISEAAIVAAGLGASLVGVRPVVDLSFDDIVPRAMDEILNQVAKARYVTAGQSQPSMTIKIDLPPVRCAQTGQRLESLFACIPGLVVAVPSDPYDAKGLMKACFRSGDVVLMIEDRWITTKQVIPSRDYSVEFGCAKVRKSGTDVTLVTYGFMVLQAMEAAAILEKEGVSLEVLDLRTIAPLDLTTILSSVRKTGRIVTVEGGWKRGGLGAEVSAFVAERMMDKLVSPPRRIAAETTHIPTSLALRMSVFPHVEEIVRVSRECVKGRAVAG